MSVPAHAPFDQAALQKLSASGADVPTGWRNVIKIERPGAPKNAPTKEEIALAQKADPSATVDAYIELLKQDKNPSDAVLEAATKLVYREESRWGVSCPMANIREEGDRGEGADKGRSHFSAGGCSRCTS